MRKVTWVAATAGLVVLAGCGATDRASDAPAAPTTEPTTATQELPASATQIRGWDIHYRDGDQIKVIKVEDLPR